VLAVGGIAWVAWLWAESAVLGVWGVLAWVIGGAAAMTSTGSWTDDAVLPRTTLSRSTEALLVAVLLVATLVVDVAVEASASPWLFVVPILVFVYADFWVWVFRELLRSTRRALG